MLKGFNISAVISKGVVDWGVGRLVHRGGGGGWGWVWGGRWSAGGGGPSTVLALHTRLSFSCPARYSVSRDQTSRPQFSQLSCIVGRIDSPSNLNPSNR